MQVGLITIKRGSVSHPHSHPNEQWTYVLKGKARVLIAGQPETMASPGTLIYAPANVVHSVEALPEEDLVFFTVKDLSHGIVGTPAK
jgi:quercetin dioxygenase-like cupin family protein